MANSTSFLFVLGLFFSVVTLLNAISCNGQSLFVFGDSLYDAGNKQYLTSDPVPSNYWPYGLSIDNPNGRWSDGRIVPDFIAKFLDIPYIPPVLNKTANFFYGANYAVADATVLGTPLESMSLAYQVEVFNVSKNLWSAKSRTKAIYMFYIGAEDYLNYTKIYTSPTSQEQKAFVNKVIEGIEQALKVIYKAGGRKFAFQNLAPLGCLPIVKQEYKSGNKCVELPTNMAAQHNDKLLETLVKLEETLDEFKFIVLDYFNSTLRRISGAENYRYFTGDISCCGTGTHNAFGCGYKNVHSNLCEFQRGYLFWDGKHNAEKTNEAFGHLVWSADPVIISPMNMRELYVYPSKVALALELKKVDEASFVPLNDILDVEN